jgi:Holliday junction resolvase
VSNVARGSAFERQVKVDLESRGWFVGHADLLAVSPDEVAFVQAKLGGPGAFPPAEWNELYSLAINYGGVPVVVHRPRRGRLEYLRMIGMKQDTGVRGPAAPCEPWTPDFDWPVKDGLERRAAQSTG